MDAKNGYSFLLDLSCRMFAENFWHGVIFLSRFYFGEKSYLKDGWNKLDFFIVVSSVISEVLKGQNLNVLRTLRVLRPLRTISRVKSLKKMLNTIFSSFSALKEIMVVVIFFNTLFAIAGQ